MLSLLNLLVMPETSAVNNIDGFFLFVFFQLQCIHSQLSESRETEKYAIIMEKMIIHKQ